MPATVELTARERQVATMIALGSQTKRIAHELKITTKTVECHRASIKRKLGGVTSVGIVLWAVRAGIIPI